MLKNATNANVGDAVALIDLRIACEKLVNMDVVSKSDPYVVVHMKDKTGKFQEIGRTERIDDNLNPQFVKAVRVPYLFEVVQELRFSCYDYDSKTQSELIGCAFCALTDIILSDTGSWRAELRLPPGSKAKKKKRGFIVVHGDDTAGPNVAMTLSFAATKIDRMDMFGKSDPFLVLSRVRDNGTTTAVAKSEVIKNTLNPTWKPVKCDSTGLCGGNEDAIVRIECFDWNKRGSPDFIGQCDTTVKELKSGSCSWALINPKKQQKKRKYKNSGMLRLTHSQCVEKASFYNFLQAGLEVQVIAAVDFTASNGSPQFSNSLHHINPYNPNEYQTALLSVGNVLEPYDDDKKIPFYGFGGVPPGHSHVKHIFPLNNNKRDAEVDGVQGMLSVYNHAIQTVKLSGPTVLAPVIQAACKEAQKHAKDGSLVFTVLLLLTDGVYTDRQQTIDAIVESSQYPLAIIIVGIGAADFERMEELDADDTRLRASNGKMQQHDNVQFVPFRDFKNQDQSALAAEVLAELPEQVVTYYASKGISKPVPKPQPAMNPAAVASTSSKPPGYDDIVLDDASSEDGEMPPPAFATASAPSYPALYE